MQDNMDGTKDNTNDITSTDTEQHRIKQITPI